MYVPSFPSRPWCSRGPRSAADPTPEQLQFFENKIRPILSENCYKCHSVELNKSKGGLTLDTKAGLLKGGETGAGVKPGDPKGSLLIKAVLYTDPDLQMPPKGEKLSDAQIADLTSWVKMGAPDPREKAKGGKLSGMTDAARRHWAFVPVKKPEIPPVKNRAWCITPVDAFIMQKLEDKGLAPSPDLLTQGIPGKDTLLRRATYDLTGLPPTPDGDQGFLTQTPARTLSPRSWIACSLRPPTASAGAATGSIPRAMPIPPATAAPAAKITATPTPGPIATGSSRLSTTTCRTTSSSCSSSPRIRSRTIDPANLAALGFITVGERFGNANDMINDRIDVVTKGFLGLTVVCARCHDHMFDPDPDEGLLRAARRLRLDRRAGSGHLPVLKASLDPKKKAAYDQAVAAVEKKNREEYYKLMGQYAGMVRDQGRRLPPREPRQAQCRCRGAEGEPEAPAGQGARSADPPGGAAFRPPEP